MRRTVFRGGDGPRVAVIAGIHGDELEGLYVCHRLAAWLEQLAETHPHALRGRVELYPGDEPARHRHAASASCRCSTPTSTATFPAIAEGLLPQRIAAGGDGGARAARRWSSTSTPATSSCARSRRCASIRTSPATLVPLAQGMNLDLIWLHGAVTVLEATIAHSLNSRGTPCLVVEMGVGMRITPSFTEQLLVGILNVWRTLGVLAPDARRSTPPTHAPLIADDDNVHYLNAETSGLFVPDDRPLDGGRAAASRSAASSRRTTAACCPRCARRSTACCSRCASIRWSTRGR